MIRLLIIIGTQNGFNDDLYSINFARKFINICHLCLINNYFHYINEKVKNDNK